MRARVRLLLDAGCSGISDRLTLIAKKGMIDPLVVEPVNLTLAPSKIGATQPVQARNTPQIRPSEEQGVLCPPAQCQGPKAAHVIP